MTDKKETLSAKRYLEQLQLIDTGINQDLEILEEMKEDAIRLRGIDYTKERVQTSGMGDKLSEDVTRYTAFNDEVNEEIEHFVDIKNKIIEEIRGLHVNNYIQILFKVYVQYKSIRQASMEMNLSYTYVIELHKKALKAFEAQYKNLHYI